jgi:hypothetical protein
MPKTSTTANASAPAQPSAGDSIVARINDVSNVIGTLVPTVGAIGSMVRLLATALRPTDAQAAQVFDDAIAAFDAKVAGLNASIDAFEQAKQQAAQPK